MFGRQVSLFLEQISSLVAATLGFLGVITEAATIGQVLGGGVLGVSVILVTLSFRETRRRDTRRGYPETRSGLEECALHGNRRSEQGDQQAQRTLRGHRRQRHVRCGANSSSPQGESLEEKRLNPHGRLPGARDARTVACGWRFARAHPG